MRIVPAPDGHNADRAPRDSSAGQSTARRIKVIGAGYVGMATAVGLASLGHDVELVEVNPDRLATLQAGRIPIAEPGLQAALDRVDRSRFSVQRAPSTKHADIAMVCVGTPINDAGRVDVSQLSAALTSLVRDTEAGSILVIRSTLPVGSTAEILAGCDAPQARTFTNPEFLRQGQALSDFLHPARVVIGCFPEADPTALDLVRSVLSRGDAPLLVVGIEEANLIKNGANAFLALKLSFTNEMALLCEELGSDIDEVLEGICLDPRIGRQYMQPSFGFGGSCLPKELRTLANAGVARGLAMHVTRAASEANLNHQERFASRITKVLGNLTGRRIALLGLAFKAGTDDVRSSPALRLAEILLDAGASVRAYDPLASVNALRALPRLTAVSRAEDALAGADAAVIGTEWAEFKDLNWAAIKGSMAAPVVFDGRRVLDPILMQSLGYRYETIGSNGQSSISRKPYRTNRTAAVATNADAKTRKL